jgi:hypothetical protein
MLTSEFIGYDYIEMHNCFFQSRVPLKEAGGLSTGMHGMLSML